MRIACAAAFLAAAVGTESALARAAADPTSSVSAGPKLMSAEEKAVESDPATGTEHALILLEETVRDERNGYTSQKAYHLRAKILSNDGRDLANVEIPTTKNETQVKRWWGFAIAPDGTLSELPQSALREQSVVKTGGTEHLSLRGVIPGVEPGSIIDYGYVIGGSGFYNEVMVELQRRFAIKKLLYRWTPYERMRGEYTLRGTETKNVAVHGDGESITIQAHDMRPVPDEPYMPPDAEVRTTVTMFYTILGSPQQYWTMVGAFVDELVAAYGPKDKSLQLVVKQMAWPPGADLAAKTRVLYEWVGRNIRNSGALSAEEFEAIGALNGKKKFTARTILTERYGNPAEINLLYASLVRAIGADARLVFAVDRTRRYWDPEFKSTSQFAFVLVAVNMPGKPDEQSVVVDAASGLPYGELPWQASGTHGVVAVSGGFRAATLLPTMADRNVGETKLALSFASNGDTLVGTWSFVGRGQQGRERRAELRAAAGEERAKAIDDLCGTRPWEPRQAEAPALEDRTAPFQLSCESENGATNFEPTLDRYTVSLIGPWWPAVTEFTESTRRLPVIFPFPKTDIVSADVAPPPGFRAADPPAPVRLDSPIGIYTMNVTAAETGFHVERKLILNALKVAPEGYEMLRKFLGDVSRADRAPLSFRPAAATP